MTIPTGRSYLIYRRSRLGEAHLLVESQRLLGIPTWQDVSDLAPEPLEDEIRNVLAEEETANAVVLLTPEVRDSAVIQRLECPLAFARHERADGFFIVFVLAGGLGYEEANSLLRVRFGNQDLDAWNIHHVRRDPLDQSAALDIAHAVLRERLKRIQKTSSPESPLRVSLYTRSKPPFGTDRALALDWSGFFDGRKAEPATWTSRLLPALSRVSLRVRELTPGRNVEFDGLASIPAVIALGREFSLPSGSRACWLQNIPPIATADRWGLHMGRSESNCIGVMTSGKVDAEDIAVLVSVAQDVRPAFDATREALPRFRCLVEVSAAGLGTGPITGGQAVDLAHVTINNIRLARSQFRPSGRVHLFASVPLGLAFMLGQLLNAVGPVQTYEYHPCGLVGRYEPSAALG